MKLEQKLYFGIRDLESLSAGILYTGSLPPMGPGGSGVLPRKGDSYGTFSPIFKPVISQTDDLTIRDLPASGFQLHIHEGENGTAHLKTYHGDRTLLSSYDAAMADAGKPAYDAMQALDALFKFGKKK
jgi:hypothetical protein